MPDFDREKIKSVLYELLRENPMSVNAILSICEIEFTDKVPTLAVTLGEKPILKINDGFVKKECLSDEHVKALLFHEFLHVLLGHCLKKPKNNAELLVNNIAFDAVINAIIHRQLGEKYSSMMSRYYAGSNYPLCLLRRPETSDPESRYSEIWRGLYKDKVVSMDIQELLKATLPLPGYLLADEGGDSDSASQKGKVILGRLIGNHSGDNDQKIPEKIKEKIKKILNSGINGLDKITGVKSRGSYDDGLDNLVASESEKRKREWEIKVYNILRKIVMPEWAYPLREKKLSDSLMPVLSQKDRRAFLKVRWDPFIPFSNWDLTKPDKTGLANIYLDVSGSMSEELPLLVKVLFYLSPYIKKPLWAFSNEVSEAVIENGTLRSRSTFGTDLVCVIKHIIETGPKTAAIVTDGFVGKVPEHLLKKALSKTKITAVISEKGNPEEIEKMGIKCHLLEEDPHD